MRAAHDVTCKSVPPLEKRRHPGNLARGQAASAKSRVARERVSLADIFPEANPGGPTTCEADITLEVTVTEEEGPPLPTLAPLADGVEPVDASVQHTWVQDHAGLWTKNVEATVAPSAEAPEELCAASEQREPEVTVTHPASDPKLAPKSVEGRRG